MIVKSVIVCLSLAVAALPASAAPAPLATSTEVPNPAPAPTSTSGPPSHRHPNMDSSVPGLSAVNKDAGFPSALNDVALPANVAGLLRRQIRVSDFDVANNSMTQPLFGTAPHLFGRGNKKAQAMDAARTKATAAAAQPSNAPAAGLPLNAATPMKAVSSGVQGLGATRMEGSNAFHEALGTAFDPMDALHDAKPSSTIASSAPQPTYSKPAPSEPLPIGPGYTTDTMDTTPGQPRPQSKQKQKRHSFMFNFNALLPEPPSKTPANPATPSSVQAWQNDALLELDSNRAPNPATLPQNVTGAATNVTGTAQGVAGNVTKSA
ncbi:hypothetical protein DAEQUDRAFT_730316 [Daedalea quercina L-15889]|uniref:Uncharacterized protein n=1 Tax=Daedalea quercina L-15889 TaxID=1314783 RepID=A0A165N052_9APHY|nr:hypothetical protein DAEQUDRAFT_730316 [Daedalea quercina L-15889]